MILKLKKYVIVEDKGNGNLKELESTSSKSRAKLLKENYKRFHNKEVKIIVRMG